MHLPAVLLLFLKVAQMNLWRERQRFICARGHPWTPSEAPPSPFSQPLGMGPRWASARSRARLPSGPPGGRSRDPPPPLRGPLGPCPSGRDRPSLPRRPWRPPRRRIASAWSPGALGDALSGALRAPARPETALPSVAPSRALRREISAPARSRARLPSDRHAPRPPALPWPSARPLWALPRWRLYRM